MERTKDAKKVKTAMDFRNKVCKYGSREYNLVHVFICNCVLFLFHDIVH